MTEVPDEFIGGKEDDVTVVLAQIFLNSKHPAGDNVHFLSKNDPYFPESKHVYKTKPDSDKVPTAKVASQPTSHREERKTQSLHAGSCADTPPTVSATTTSSTLHNALKALDEVKQLKATI